MWIDFSLIYWVSFSSKRSLIWGLLKEVIAVDSPMYSVPPSPPVSPPFPSPEQIPSWSPSSLSVFWKNSILLIRLQMMMMMMMPFWREYVLLIEKKTWLMVQLMRQN